MIKIEYSGDISPYNVEYSFKSLPDEIEIELPKFGNGARATDSPAWIQLIAEADWWVKIFGAAAALFVAEVIKEAGKSTWQLISNNIIKLFNSLQKIKREGGSEIIYQVGFSFPSPDYPTIYTIRASNEEEFVKQFCLFIHYIPKVITLLKEKSITANDVTGWIFLEQDEIGNIEVCFMNSKNLERIKYKIFL